MHNLSSASGAGCAAASNYQPPLCPKKHNGYRMVAAIRRTSLPAGVNWHAFATGGHMARVREGRSSWVTLRRSHCIGSRR